MRILVVTPFLPDARACHGGGAYLANLLTGLAEVAEVGLVALLDAAEVPRWAGDHPWRYGLFATRPPARPGLGGLRTRLRHLWAWRRLPLVAAKSWHAQLPDLLRRALAEWQPDGVMVELAQMAQYLPFLTRVPTILTDHEAGCPANVTTGLGPAGDARDRALWRRYAATHYPQASAVQAVTPEDQATLQALLGRAVQVRSPVVAVSTHPARPAAAPIRALFIGDYSHAPNPEAARRIVHEVLPLLRRALPTAELWLAGPHSERVADLGSVAGVHLAGFVPDLAALFASTRLLLAPVYSGGGFRMKVLTALAHGVPVVTNALGARGIAAPLAAMARGETAAELASAAMPWLQSP
ncbi:MAG: glycosyltransferase, partial [Planctomycetota bacterium]